MAAGDLVECAPAPRPSRHNRRAGGQPVLAPRAISRLRKPLTGGACAGAPRDWSRPPPRRASCPPRRGPACRRSAEASSISTRPDSAVSPSRRAITAMILCFTAQAVLDPETAAEFHRRDALLRRHDQVNGCEPERQRQRQRQLGRMEDRARRGRCLLLAPVALIEPAPRQHAMPAMAAAGAGSRPANAAGPAPRGTAPPYRKTLTDYVSVLTQN